MKKYPKNSAAFVQETMHELKTGKLKSSTGQSVTDPRQAIAIGLSEARAADAKKSTKKVARKNK